MPSRVLAEIRKNLAVRNKRRWKWNRSSTFRVQMLACEGEGIKSSISELLEKAAHLASQPERYRSADLAQPNDHVDAGDLVAIRRPRVLIQL